MELPEAFLENIKKLMDEKEYKSFLDSYSKERLYGLRVNTLKISVEEFKKIAPFRIEPVEWTDDGFYYDYHEKPGIHPYYHAGLYYMQEPSAMIPAMLLNALPGENVLDLCAAPGGKTIKIADDMRGQGIIFANDISASRVKALTKNIELLGIQNVVITKEHSLVLSKKYPKFFDKILVDAPCSGEGMFRKDKEAVKSWEKYKAQDLSKVQKELLCLSHEMLKPGGLIVYSTCTFNPEENEKVIAFFINKYPEYKLVDRKKEHGFEGGRTDWCQGCQEIEKALRIWPHKAKGEGHFVAIIKNKSINKNTKTVGSQSFNSLNKKEWDAFHVFERQNLNIDFKGEMISNLGHIYFIKNNLPDLNGIKATKFGLYMGRVNKGIFTPSHALALSLRKKDINNTIDFKCNSPDINRYLKGETIILENNHNNIKEGFLGVCVDGYTVGWAKNNGGILKNFYPAPWRKKT